MIEADLKHKTSVAFSEFKKTLIVSSRSVSLAMATSSAGYAPAPKERKFLMFKCKYDPSHTVDEEFKELADAFSKAELKDEIDKANTMMETLMLRIDYLKSLYNNEGEDEDDDGRYVVKVGYMTNDPTKFKDLNVSQSDSLATLKADIGRLFKVPKTQLKGLSLVMNETAITLNGKTSIKKANIVANSVVILQ